MLLFTIKKRPDFVTIGKDNVRFYSKTMLLLARKTPEKFLKNPTTGEIVDFCRVGYTVTKQIGKAVVRNKVKRRYKEAFRLLFKDYAHNHFDYVILAKKDVKKASFRKIYGDLKFCFKGVNKLMLSQNKNNKN